MVNQDTEKDAAKITRQARVMNAYQSAVEKIQRLDKDFSEDIQLEVQTKTKKPKSPAEFCCPARMAHMLAIDEGMLPYKLLYIFFRGGLACITPYLAVHLSQRGFGPLQAGAIASASCFLSAVVTPLLGFIADKFKCRKGLLIASLIAWMLLTISLTFLPSPKRAPCNQAFRHLRDTIGLSDEHKVICNQITSNNTVKSLLIDPLHVLHVPEPVVNFSAACPAGRTLTEDTQKVKKDELLYAFRSPENYKRHRAATGTNRSWLYDSDSLRRTFSYVFLLITLGEVMQAATLFLTDTAALHRLGPEKRGRYGWQRSFGSAGYALYAISLDEFLQMSQENIVVCGIVVPITDYRIATVIFVGTLGCALALIIASCFKLRYVYTTPFEYRFNDIQPAFFSFHYGSVILTAFFLAICNGCTDGYLYRHLTRLGATQYILGMMLAIRGGSELLVASYTSYLIKRFGNVPLLFFGLAAYFIRFLWYSILSDPWWCIPAEIVHGVSIALTWNIFTAYMSEAIPSQNMATLQGFITGIYHGLGKGIGLLLAGLLVESYGTFITFSIFAVGCVMYAIFFLVIQKSSEQPSAMIKYAPVPTDEDIDRGHQR
ncbi:major facilitator superfamily domain-containing protein 6-like [Amphiura filiformis]|uniref:major facilitator superfamily domain-containing protein 6-like n=1 Tax=Amphiura filiformis TaxID=82378 RepID=UPI003B21A650